jgi:hypothetical protein
MSRLHDKQINNNFSNTMPIGNSNNLNYHSMNMAHFTNVPRPMQKLPKITSGVFNSGFPLDNPQTKIPGDKSIDASFNIGNTLNSIQNQQKNINDTINQVQQIINSTANLVLNTSKNREETIAANDLLNAAQQQLNATQQQLKANDQLLYVNIQKTNKSLVDSANKITQMAAREAVKASVNADFTSKNLSVRFNRPELDNSIKSAIESAAKAAAVVSDFVAKSYAILTSINSPSIMTNNNDILQAAQSTADVVKSMTNSLSKQEQSLQTMGMQKLFGNDFDKNNPLTQLDDNYMKMKFDNNNNWNAIQIKGEQKVLSAFRNGGYQQESMSDSQSCKIRSNFIPTNKDARRTKSALALLSHESA